MWDLGSGMENVRIRIRDPEWKNVRIWIRDKTSRIRNTGPYKSFLIYAELKPLLGILREKFPKKVLGTVGSDLGRLVKTFANGQLVEVKKPKSTLGYMEDPSYAYCEVQVGRLNMPDAEILGNLSTLLETLKESEPRRAGGFITRCELYVEGLLDKKFSISHELVDDIKWKEFVKSSDKEIAATN
jgi:hypothetical protein